MESDLDQALDESLDLLQSGQATLEECVSRYPEHASELRSLLQVALAVLEVPPPVSSPAAFASGKRRMLEALREKRRRQVLPSLARFFRHAGVLLDQVTASLRHSPALRVALSAALILLALFSGVLLTFRGEPAAAEATALVEIEGAVDVLPAGKRTWHEASIDGEVRPGSRVRTGSMSAVTLVFSDGSTTHLEDNTEVALVTLESSPEGGDRVVILYQRRGSTRSSVQHLTGPNSRFEIQTPAASVAVRGTEFTVAVDEGGRTRVSVVEGSVDVMAGASSLALEAGYGMMVERGQSPAPVYPLATAVPTVVPTPTSTPARPQQEGEDSQPEPHRLPTDHRGRPEDVGPPEHAGPPDDTGPPEHAGPPDDTGPPDHAGPPEDTGPPDHAGPPDDTGPPDHAGPPDDTGPPSGKGPPDRAH